MAEPHIQAFILSADLSGHCHPLTITKPKPLLQVAGSTILDHILAELEGLVDETIIVDSSTEPRIVETLDQTTKGRSIRFAQPSFIKNKAPWQQDLLSANAKILILDGTSIPQRNDIERMLQHRCAVLAAECEDSLRSQCVTEDGVRMATPNSLTTQTTTGFVFAGAYVFDQPAMELITEKEGASEKLDLPKIATRLAQRCEMRIIVASEWLPTDYAWDLLHTNEQLMKRLKGQEIAGTVEEHVTIHGPVRIGQGSVLKNGTYIEGPAIIGDNCEIGPNCYIRGATSLGNGCKIGQAVEVKNIILMDNSKIPHLSYVGDSVIGESVNFGAGTTTANLRHDHASVQTMVNNQLVSTARRKLGAIVGDNVHTGINTCIYPGRKIWPNQTTRPGEIVTKDIK